MYLSGGYYVLLRNTDQHRCCYCRWFTWYYSDMPPPLKSLILKWGLLAQWLYWAKYLQAILACPAIFCPDTGIFSFLLSGYGQFMLPASFLLLHGYWSLHFDLCPSHFHTNSDKLFRIISALFLSFRIYCIFCLKGKSGLPLLILFPSIQAYIPAYSGTSRIH